MSSPETQLLLYETVMKFGFYLMPNSPANLLAFLAGRSSEQGVALSLFNCFP